MKNIKYIFLSVWTVWLLSCDVSYNDDMIDPSKPYGTARDIDPYFASTGFQDVVMISIYKNYTHTVVFNRTFGVSRSLNVDIQVDEAALNAYNALYETNYKLLPAEYYSLPTSVTFGELTQNANFTVTFYPEKLVTAVGFEAASGYVLPIKATTEQAGASLDSALVQTLLHPDIDLPTIYPAIPSAAQALSFINNSGLAESVTIEGELNFVDFDASLVSVEGIQDDVDAYNAANGTSYELLPAANYDFSEIAADEEGGLLTINGEINADGLDPDKKYLLPARVRSSLYTIDQSAPIYYTVSIVDLEFVVTNGGSVVAKNISIVSASGNLNVTMNSLIADDITINFKHDPSLVDAYNAANGTSYRKLAEDGVSVTGTVMTGGTKSANASYTINAELENGVRYLVPFVLQESDLELGSVSGSPIVYLDVTKTVYNLSVTEAVNDSYAATAVQFDFAAAASALCTTEDKLRSGIAFYGINKDGNLITGYTANTGFWYDKNGNVCNWGATGCTLYVEYAPDGIFNVGQFPGAATAGDTYIVSLALVYQNNLIRYNITVNITAQ